jgi:hypothetical protein
MIRLGDFYRFGKTKALRFINLILNGEWKDRNLNVFKFP